MIGNKILNFYKKLKTKFWFSLFVKIGAVFTVFVLVLTVSNSAFLTKFYEHSKKKELIKAGTEIKNADVNDNGVMVELLSRIGDDYGFECEIYGKNGKTLFSSSGGQMLDWLSQENDKLHMNHRPLEIIETKNFEDGTKMQIAKEERTEKEYFVYVIPLERGATGEVRIQRSIIKDSADIANKFIAAVAVLVLLISLVWVFFFAKKIAKPISEMNKITGKMSQMEFSEKLVIRSDDEIGELSNSINILSRNLYSALEDLKEKNAKLKDEIEAERRLDEMRKGFVANVSHELKTPISIIKGYTEGLKLDINKDAREKYCDIIIDESDRMNKLVLSLLELSKYESGQVKPKFNSFNLSNMLKSMANRILEQEKGITLNLNFEDDLKALGDELQIEQVIKSYFENALSHTKSGGEIEVTVESKDKKHTVYVYNTGEKIDEKIMPEIWQSFYRGDTSHKRESFRFGLGLSIVSAIIKLHGETCGVYNTKDGVCFWFTVSKN